MEFGMLSRVSLIDYKSCLFPFKPQLYIFIEDILNEMDLEVCLLIVLLLFMRKTRGSAVDRFFKYLHTTGKWENRSFMKLFIFLLLRGAKHTLRTILPQGLFSYKQRARKHEEILLFFCFFLRGRGDLEWSTLSILMISKAEIIREV